MASAHDDCVVWTADSLTKIMRSSLPPEPPPRAVRMSAARNEYESAQVVIRAGARGLEDVNVEASDLAGPGGRKIPAANVGLYRVAYIRLPAFNTHYPDPLPPVTPFAVEPERTQPVWITVHVPKGTPAGDYRGTLDISIAGKPARQVPLILTVWSFTLPDKPASRTAFGIIGAHVAAAHGVDTDSRAYADLMARYYEALLQHRISAFDPPVALDSPDVSRYLDDPRVTAFVIPYSDDSRQLRAVVARCRKNGWLGKAYFYPLDEPGSAEHYATLRQRADRIHAIDRSLRVVTPYYCGPGFETDKTVYGLLDGYTDIWCPKVSYFDDQALRARQTKGAEIWWYVCWEPGRPFPNFFVDYDGIEQRILMWMQKLYDVQGLLYWCTTYWNPSDTKDVWEDVATVKGLSPSVYGDGSLFYPGSKVGLDGPVSSIRLECIRDGLEDFDYLALLERKIGADNVKRMIRRLVRSRTDYEKSPRLLQQLRRQIARELEKR